MTSLTERLKFVIDLDAGSAIKGFGDVEKSASKSLTTADSKLDKTAGQMTKFGAGALAMSGIAAGALFKTASEFADLGIAAGKFSDTTGLAVDDASRWIEVAADMGVETATVEGAFNKMNIAADKSPGKFAAIGAEIVRTKDGAVDVNATFLNVVDSLNGIQDPAEKARRAADLLGKGWTGMSELIETGSDTLKTSLASVSDAKVINPEEEQRAKDLRAGMDTLKDSVENLVLTIGGALAPAFSTIATAVGGAVEKFNDLNEASGGLLGKVAGIGTVVLGAAGAVSVIAGKVITMRDKFHDADGSITKMGSTMKTVGKVAGVFAGTLAVLDIIDRVAGNATNADAELNTLIVTLGKKPSTNYKPVVDDFTDLGKKAYEANGIVSNVFGAIGAGLSETKIWRDTMTGAFDDVLAKSPEQALLLVDALNQMAEAAKNGDKAAKDWIEEYGIGSKQIAGFEEKINSSAAAQAILTETTSETAVATRGMGEAARDSKTDVDEWAEGVKAGKEAAKELSDKALDDLESALDDSGTAFDEAATAASNFAGAIDSVYNPALDLESATRAIYEGVISMSEAFGTAGKTGDDLKESQARVKAGFEITTKAGLENRQTVEAQAKAILGYASAAIGSGQSAEEAAGHIAFNTQALKDQLIAQGFTTEAVNAYIAQLGLTPENITTTVELAKDEETKAKIQGIIDNLGTVDAGALAEVTALVQAGELDTALTKVQTLAGYDGKQVDMKVVVTAAQIATSNYQGPKSKGLAMGGPAAAGSIHEVVEGGRSELLHENGKTYLLSAQDGYVEPLTRGSASAGGGVTYNDYSVHNYPPGVTDQSFANARRNEARRRLT